MDMNREEVIATLKAHQPELMAIGILHAGLFGSVARGEQTPESDIDILVELDRDKVRGVFAYTGIKRQVGELFETDVDVISKSALRPELHEPVNQDLISAF
jgi:predicted nucleotidyltransferase